MPQRSATAPMMINTRWAVSRASSTKTMTMIPATRTWEMGSVVEWSAYRRRSTQAALEVSLKSVPSSPDGVPSAIPHGPTPLSAGSGPAPHSFASPNSNLFKGSFHARTSAFGPPGLAAPARSPPRCRTRASSPGTSSDRRDSAQVRRCHAPIRDGLRPDQRRPHLRPAARAHRSGRPRGYPPG